MAKEQQNSGDFGAIWINGEADQITLGIAIDDKRYTGKKNPKKTDENSRLPDYLITEKDGTEEVGAAWRGETGTGREKLRMKIGETFYTAVMRDETKGKQADMFIYPPDNS